MELDIGSIVVEDELDIGNTELDAVVVYSGGGDVSNKVDKILREDATDIYTYDEKENSVPYLYGVYGDKNDGYTETQGLIKGSMGKIVTHLAKEIEEIDPEASRIIADGIIPSEYRYLIDPHTIAIRDGNCAIPCGKHIYDEDENGNIINSKLYYGTAVPTSYMKDYVKQQLENLEIPEGQSNNSNIVNAKNSNGLYQESEKDDTAVTLNFTDIPIADKSGFAGTYDRTNADIADIVDEKGKYKYKTTVALGTSVAKGDRSFACGSSNLAKGPKSIAMGCDNYAGDQQCIAMGYANYANGVTSTALGNRNISTGAGSFATGTECQAKGNASNAMGTGSIASGIFSTAIGNQARANYDNQVAVGKFNDCKSDTIFEVGNGTEEGNRNTAFAVLRTGNGIRIGNTDFTEETINVLFETVGELYNSLDGLEDLLGGI